MSELGAIEQSKQELYALKDDTEKSAEKILSASESIMAIIAESSSIDENLREKLGEKVITILEACHFQDFCGQRVSKLIKNLDYIKDNVGEVSSRELSEYDKLLEGPQIEAANQDLADNLFNS